MPMTPAENWSRTKEVLAAYWRQGLRELGEALDNSGSSTVYPEMGTIATKPQSMISDGLRGREALYGKDDVDMNMNHKHDPEPEPEIEPEDPDLDLD